MRGALEPTVAPDPPDAIRQRLARGGPALVALSGGVDSSAVALLAFEALGDRAIAVTLASPAVTRTEVERAETVGRRIGIRHTVLEVDPLAVPEYRANPTNRCYFCRRTEATRLRAFGDAEGVGQYLDGVHRDDLGDDRPGLIAMAEAGFAHPLLDAAWHKADVRAFARASGLPNWDAPSDACLASRIAHGDPISAELLGRVAEAEAWIRDRGFRRVRVRVAGRSARVVVGAAEVPQLLAEPVASSTITYLAGLGFGPVTLDPTGYRPRPGA